MNINMYLELPKSRFNFNSLNCDIKASIVRSGIHICKVAVINTCAYSIVCLPLQYKTLH